VDSTHRTVLERIARHDRAVLVVMLVAVPLACWSWIVPMARDMYGSMSGPSAWMMTDLWDGPHLLLLGAMWFVMMAGMMLPSAALTLLLYAGAARHRSTNRHAAWWVYAMAAGYLLVWAGFSVGATLLQRMLSTLLLVSPMMKVTSPRLSGALLIGAGVYQLMPIKQTCLASCSAPLVFLTRRWRDGATGAFTLGIEHGLFCTGCCWALMLLLFAGGVMNLAVIGALTVFVLVERLVPLGQKSVQLTGALLIVLGLWVLAV
jgi:predicted metal-binding membrane protein